MNAPSAKSLFRAMKAKPELGSALPMELHNQARTSRRDERRKDDWYPTGQPEAIRSLLARDGHGRWLRHTLDMPGWTYLALLLSWDWPAARKNGLGAMLEQNPFSCCYLMRWKLDFTGEGSPPQRNAWFVWVRGWDQVPMQMRFMDKADPRQKEMSL